VNVLRFVATKWKSRNRADWAQPSTPISGYQAKVREAGGQRGADRPEADENAGLKYF
jgi:hypothetical protein